MQWVARGQAIIGATKSKVRVGCSNDVGAELVPKWEYQQAWSIWQFGSGMMVMGWSPFV